MIETTKALIVAQDNWDEVEEYIDKRFYQSNLCSMKLVAGEEVLMPKNKGVEYLKELIMCACMYPSNEVSYRELMYEIWSDNILSKEPTMIKGVKEYTTVGCPILFSVIYRDIIKRWGEFV